MSDFSEYIKKYISTRSGPDRRFGLNALARSMEVSPANLSKVLSLKLKISSELEIKILNYMSNRMSADVDLKKMINQHNRLVDIMSRPAGANQDVSRSGDESVLFDKSGTYRIKKKNNELVKAIINQFYADFNAFTCTDGEIDTENEELIFVNTLLSKVMESSQRTE